jgi:hypothetical protein
MGTTTPNYSLYKPATSDFVNVTTDINNNMDSIDTALAELDTRLDVHEAVHTSWTPTVSADTTNPTFGTGGFVAGRYLKMGQTLFFKIRTYVGSGGSTAGNGTYYWSLPAGLTGYRANDNVLLGPAYLYVTSVIMGVVQINSDGTKFSIATHGGGAVGSTSTPNFGTAGALYTMQGVLELV